MQVQRDAASNGEGKKIFVETLQKFGQALTNLDKLFTAHEREINSKIENANTLLSKLQSDINSVSIMVSKAVEDIALLRDSTISQKA